VIVSLVWYHRLAFLILLLTEFFHFFGWLFAGICVAVLVFHSLVSLWEYLLPAVRVFLIFRLVVGQLVETLVYLDDLTLLISFI
jgi:hypothetical protein